MIRPSLKKCPHHLTSLPLLLPLLLMDLQVALVTTAAEAEADGEAEEGTMDPAWYVLSRFFGKDLVEETGVF